MALATLSIDLVAKLAKFEADLGKAARASEKNSARMNKAFSTVKSTIAALGVSFGVVKVAGMVQGILEAQDALSKMSQKLGISVEGLAGLQHAADLSGVNLESLQKGLKSVSSQMFDASQGMAESKKNFAALGVEIRNTNGTLKSSDQVLVEIADKFAGMKDGTAKAALAVKLFGKAGLDMIPMLNGGSAALSELVAQGQRLNPVTAESARLSEEFNDNMLILRKTMGQLGITIANDALPMLNEVSKALLQGAENYRKFREAGLLGTILKDAALDVVGLGKLTDDAGADIRKLMAEREKLLERQKSPLSGLAWTNIQDDLEGIDHLLQVARIRQANAVSAMGGDYADAISRKIKGKKLTDFVPTEADPKGSKKKEQIDQSAHALAAYVKQLSSAVEKTKDLSASEEALAFLRSQGAAGEIPQVRELVLGLAAQIDKEKELTEARKQAAEYFDKLSTDNASIDQSNEALRAQVKEIGLTKEALNALTLARLDATIAQEQKRAAMMSMNGASQEEIVFLERKIALMKEQRGLTAKGQIAQGLADTATEQDKASKDFAATLHNDVKGALSNAFRDTNDPLKAFGDALANMIFTRATNALAESITSSLFSSGSGSSGGVGLLASLFGVSSFDGGGYTGAGARAGGVDGKGGFLSVMHPNETVIDHTKGQKAGNLTVVQNFTVGDVASVSMLRQAVAGSERRIQAGIGRSMQYGGALA